MGKRVLAIDTATTACSIALFEDAKLIDSNFEEIGRGHAERLIPMVAQLPDKGRADQILVNCGPGSFTGVRIGLSAAKALAMAWHADVSGYQCLNLVAAQALVDMEHASPVFVVMVGGHGEYFVQNFDADGSPLDDLLSLSPESALRHAKTNMFVGSAAQSLASLTDGADYLAVLPDAAKSMLLGGHHQYLDAKPIYGRAPDAQPARQA